MSAFTLVYTRALKIYKSDNALIPTPNQITSGTSTGTTANKLTASAATFITKGVSIGDVVFNTTDGTAATVTAVDSETVLSLSANIIAVASKAFIILANNDAIASTNKGCYLYVGSAGNVSVTTIGGDTVTFDAVPAGTILPVQIKQLNSTGTVPTSFLALW